MVSAEESEAKRWGKDWMGRIGLAGPEDKDRQMLGVPCRTTMLQGIAVVIPVNTSVVHEGYI